MNYNRKFKKEFTEIHFNGDPVFHGGNKYFLFGTTGFDADMNTIQIRDELMLQDSKTKKTHNFNKILSIWDEIHEQLLFIVKDKVLVRKE